MKRALCLTSLIAGCAVATVCAADSALTGRWVTAPTGQKIFIRKQMPTEPPLPRGRHNPPRAPRGPTPGQGSMSGMDAANVQPSNLITLCPAITVANSISGGSFPAPNEVFPDPVGIDIDLGTACVAVVKLTAVPVGGNGSSIQINLETSYDNGTTWQDMIGAQLFATNGIATYYIPVSTIAKYNSMFTGGAPSNQSDGIAYGNRVSQGPVGTKFRVGYSSGVAAGDTGSFMFQVFVMPTGSKAGVAKAPVELAAPITTNMNGSVIAPNPLGTRVVTNTELAAILRVTSVPSGGSGQLLDVYFQHSCDDGQTWNDFAHMQSDGAVGGVTHPGNGLNWFWPVSLWYPGPTSVTAISDGTLAANTLVQGPLGKLFRLKYSSNMGTGNTGSWSFQAFVLPN